MKETDHATKHRIALHGWSQRCVDAVSDPVSMFQSKRKNVFPHPSIPRRYEVVVVTLIGNHLRGNFEGVLTVCVGPRFTLRSCCFLRDADGPVRWYVE